MIYILEAGDEYFSHNLCNTSWWDTNQPNAPSHVNRVMIHTTNARVSYLKLRTSKEHACNVGTANL